MWLSLVKQSAHTVPVADDPNAGAMSYGKGGYTCDTCCANMQHRDGADGPSASIMSYGEPDERNNHMLGQRRECSCRAIVRNIAVGHQSGHPNTLGMIMLRTIHHFLTQKLECTGWNVAGGGVKHAL